MVEMMTTEPEQSILKLQPFMFELDEMTYVIYRFIPILVYETALGIENFNVWWCLHHHW